MDIPELKSYDATECATVTSTDEIEVSWDEVHSAKARNLSTATKRTCHWKNPFLLLAAAIIVGVLLISIVIPANSSHKKQAASAPASAEAPVRSDERDPVDFIDTGSQGNSTKDDGSYRGDGDSSHSNATRPAASSNATDSETDSVSIFYVIGDVPYTSAEAVGIQEQLINLPSDAEFVVHVGDLRNASGNPRCQAEDYAAAADLFRLSPVPVFVLVGDNDWNDCPNPDEGLGYWRDEFLGFESKHWNFSYSVSRLSGHPETFTFRHKGTLFVGLQLVGGDVLNEEEWTGRLTNQTEWVQQLIGEYKDSLSENVVGRVVIFGHADPKSKHKDFFNPLKDYIANDLDNQLPIVYINGDGHLWNYNSTYYGQESFLRIMVTGGSSEPPLKMMVDGNGNSSDTGTAFLYDRRL